MFFSVWMFILIKNKKGKSVMPKVHWKNKKNLIMQNALDSISLGPVWVEYLLFFVISFINVFLQNLKYIFLIKSTKLRAALVGMVTSIFYATVVVLIAKHGWVSVLIIAGTHFLGIYAAKSLCEFLEERGYLEEKY